VRESEIKREKERERERKREKEREREIFYHLKIKQKTFYHIGGAVKGGGAKVGGSSREHP